MKNIVYYLKKHGNKSFNELEFNEIDSLILSQLSYLYFEKICKDLNGYYKLKDYLKVDYIYDLCKGAMNYKWNIRLVRAFQDTKRYDELYFSDIDPRFDTSNNQQFYAMTFHLKDFIYISFRGTDLSFNGWREDFNMWFKEETPCQRDSIEYVEKIYDKYKKNMIIGGHSKGGNLAFYSSMYCKDEVVDKILKIYSFDGPGLKDKEPFLSYEYFRIKNRLVTFSSAASIVAVLLYHVDNVEFLKSSSVSILQHSAYNWHIENDKRLLRTKNNELLSRFLDRSLTRFLTVSKARERQRFVDILFYLAQDNPDASIMEIRHHPLKYLRSVRTRKRLLSQHQYKFLKLELKKMSSCFKEVFFERMQNRKKKIAKKILLSKKQD